MVLHISRVYYGLDVRSIKLWNGDIIWAWANNKPYCHSRSVWECSYTWSRKLASCKSLRYINDVDICNRTPFFVKELACCKCFHRTLRHVCQDWGWLALKCWLGEWERVLVDKAVNFERVNKKAITIYLNPVFLNLKSGLTSGKMWHLGKIMKIGNMSVQGGIIVFMWKFLYFKNRPVSQTSTIITWTEVITIRLMTFYITPTWLLLSRRISIPRMGNCKSKLSVNNSIFQVTKSW